MLLCNPGSEEFQGWVPALVMYNSETDNLHLVSVRLLEGSAVEAGHLAEGCLHDQENIKISS